MDDGSLRALRQRVQPIALNGSFTLEQASSAMALNRDIERFHAAVAQAERLLELAGVIEVRLEHELAARALELTRARVRVEMSLTSARAPHAERSPAPPRARGDATASARDPRPPPPQAAATTRRPLE